MDQPPTRANQARPADAHPAPPTGARRAPRQIAILVFPGVQSLDLTGPLEVFSGAQQLIDATDRRERGYEITVLAARARRCRPPAG